MKYRFNKECLFSIFLISLLLVGCSGNTTASNNTVTPDPIIDIQHTYEINQNTKQGTINIEIKNVTKEVLKELQIHVNAKSSSYVKEYKVSSISPGKAEKISINLGDRPYPRDLRIYVKGYYYIISKNTTFTYDYPLEPKLKL